MARRVTAAVREMNDAHRRMTALSTAMDRHMGNPDVAPDTYREFLVRTSGVLIHEPSARKRARRRLQGS